MISEIELFYKVTETFSRDVIVAVASSAAGGASGPGVGGLLGGGGGVAAGLPGEGAPVP